MHRTLIISSLALALTSRAAAQGIDHDDIGPNCVALCTNIANLSDQCEQQYNNEPNEDQQKSDCICNGQGMDSLIPQCEACQRQYYGMDDDYNDIQTLLARCGFSSMSMIGSMTVTVPSSVYTTTYTQTDIDREDNETDIDVEIDTVTSYDLSSATTRGGNGGGAAAGATQTANDAATSAADAAGSAANSASNAAGSAASGASQAATSATDAAGSAAEQSGNFAPAITASPVLAVAGVAAAVFGL